MKVDGVPHRTIRVAADGWSVEIIDQTRLPYAFELRRLTTLDEVATAIRDMQVRGAPLIGVTAAYGLALAMRGDPSDGMLEAATQVLCATRPTAVNLRWALEQMNVALRPLASADRERAAYATAAAMADDDVEVCRQIGEHGLKVIRDAWEQRGREGRVEVLTHCNAGWLATVDWGTALAPIYRAHDEGIPVHVWVDETRPRSQGFLTAWELGRHGVPYTVIPDNAGGHLMQHGRVDLCIVGTDRTTRRGDVCNKIGTYLKALAAGVNGVPFYVAAPSSSIDWSIEDGVAEIPIEERDAREVLEITGATANGLATVRVGPPDARAANPAFDVTPAGLVTGIITERGICDPDDILSHFPERA